MTTDKPKIGLPLNWIGKVFRSWQRFRAWQVRPYRYAPMPDNQQWHCVNCGESFDGNYCPRCGQAGLTRRLTVVNAINGALDVWGMGGKSLLRNWLHLLFRPGYMMADYIRGHRQPYFPPFKMLFIMAAMFAILVYGTRLIYPAPPDSYANRWSRAGNELVNLADSLVVTDSVVAKVESKDSGPVSVNRQPASQQAVEQSDSPERTSSGSNTFKRLVRHIFDFLDTHEAVVALMSTFYTSLMCRLMFRRRSRIPNMTITEHFFAHVMIQSQIILLSIIYFLLSLFWYPGGSTSMSGFVPLALYYIDFRQLYGYGRWATLWRIVMLFFGLILLSFLLAALIVWAYAYL